MDVAGFYFRNYEDVCVCFHYGIEIFQWKPQDQPLGKHLKHSPGCDFSLKNFDEETVYQAIADNCLQSNLAKIRTKFFGNYNYNARNNNANNANNANEK